MIWSGAGSAPVALVSLYAALSRVVCWLHSLHGVVVVKVRHRLLARWSACLLRALLKGQEAYAHLATSLATYSERVEGSPPCVRRLLARCGNPEEIGVRHASSCFRHASRALGGARCFARSQRGPSHHLKLCTLCDES